MNSLQQYKVGELLFRKKIEKSLNRIKYKKYVYEESSSSNSKTTQGKFKSVSSSNISSYQTRSSSASCVNSSVKNQIKLQLANNIKRPDLSFYMISARNKSITAKNKEKLLYHNNSLPLLPFVDANRKKLNNYYIDTEESTKLYENEFKDNLFRKLKEKYKFMNAKKSTIDNIFKLSSIARHKEDDKIKRKYPFFIKRLIIKQI